MLGAVSAHYYCYYYYYYLTFCVSLPRNIPLPSFLQTVYILSSSSIAVTRFLHNNVTIKKIYIYCSKTESEDGHIRCLIQAVARGSLLEGPVCLFRTGLGLFGGQADHCADRKHCLADHHVGTSVSIQSPPFFSLSLVHTSFLVVIAAVKWASFIAA